MSRFEIAETLKRLRAKSGLKADEVGALLGKSGKTVNAWENGRGQPDADTLIALSDIYGVVDILAEFRGKESESFSLSDHEKDLIIAYRSQPSLQLAVDRTLGISEEDKDSDKKEKRA